MMGSIIFYAVLLIFCVFFLSINVAAEVFDTELRISKYEIAGWVFYTFGVFFWLLSAVVERGA